MPSVRVLSCLFIIIAVSGIEESAYCDTTGLLFTEFYAVRGMNGDGSGLRTIYQSSNVIYKGIDYNPIEQTAYWVDFNGGYVRRIGLDGSNLTTIFRTDFPSDIALDYEHGRMYYTADTNISHSTIRSAALDGSDERVLATTTDFGDGIALDRVHQKIYWMTFRELQRSNLDGSNVETLATRGWDGYADVDLDLRANKVYWTDRYYVYRSNLDGTQRESFLAPSTDTDRLVIDPDANKVVWTAWDGIWRASLAPFGANPERIYANNEYKWGLAYVPEPYTLALILGLALIVRRR